MVGCAIRMRVSDLHRAANHHQQNAQQRQDNSPWLCCTRKLAV
jgi:hypothetical protein